MSASGEAFAIAAHLHVLLRRKTGRVTDTEWMATNADYAREIVRHAREKAASDGHAELLPWADKLEAVIGQMAGTPIHKPLLQTAVSTLQAGQVSAAATRAAPNARAGGFANTVPAQPSASIESALNAAFGRPAREGDDPDGRYIGGLR